MEKIEASTIVYNAAREECDKHKYCSEPEGNPCVYYTGRDCAVYLIAKAIRDMKVE